jgi:uncharacterized protein YggL (DUF469 family)
MNLQQAIKEQKEYHEDNYDDNDDYTDDDAIDDLMSECGNNGSDGCNLAGTEYCDWECPFS